MSYLKLNQVTQPFPFPIPLFNDSLQDINTKTKYFINVGMENGYFQVVAEEEAR